MTKIGEFILQEKQEKFQLQNQETVKILCLNDPADDDLHKIYFIESQRIKGKYYKVITTAFGATSCSCVDQTKNPYQICKHMKVLDEILLSSPEQQQLKIQKVKQLSHHFILSY